MIKKKSKKEVKEALKKLIQKYKLDKKLNVDILEKEVFNSSIKDNVGFATKVFTEFGKKNLSEIDSNLLLQVWSDFWNYLPHKELGGKSPYEKMGEMIEDDSNLAKKEIDSEKEMIVQVGDKKMSKSEFEKMLVEMEKEQAPFKKQIDEKLLPEYERFLKKRLKQKAVDRHLCIAKIFLERALFLGFVKYELIKESYAFCGFSVWWQTHVMWGLSETTIENSVIKFTNFVFTTFNMELYDDSVDDLDNDSVISPYLFN